MYDNDPAAAKQLLDGGFDVNMKCPTGGYIQPGITALHLAAEDGALEVAEVLLDRRADVEVRDLQGGTALHYVVDQLLHSGAPKRINSTFGFSNCSCLTRPTSTARTVPAAPRCITPPWPLPNAVRHSTCCAARAQSTTSTPRPRPATSSA